MFMQHPKHMVRLVTCLSLLDIDNPILSLCKLVDEYGPIFRLKVPGYTSLILSGHELVADVCGDGSKMAPDV